MLYRCNTATAHEYDNYGGRGISVCEEWSGENGYINFRNWAINNGYSEGLTIDRICVNGNYCPENCQWVTLSENTSRSNKDNRKQRRKSNLGTYYCIDTLGTYIEFDNASKFAREHSLKPEMVRKSAYKNKSYKNYKFGFVCNK